MTSKELLYVEDAIGHEKFLKTCSCKSEKNLQDPKLATYIGQLEQNHTNLLNKFINLL